jgi:hypothetical protein
MSNEELIAQARELCEKNLSYWTNTELWSMGGKDEQINSWTTHLAEMDEHERKDPTCDCCRGTPTCDYCELDDKYPCDFLVTKAKRLLGVK